MRYSCRYAKGFRRGVVALLLLCGIACYRENSTSAVLTTESGRQYELVYIRQEREPTQKSTVGLMYVTRQSIPHSLDEKSMKSIQAEVVTLGRHLQNRWSHRNLDRIFILVTDGTTSIAFGFRKDQAGSWYQDSGFGAETR